METIPNFEREYRQKHFAFPEIKFQEFEQIQDLKIRKDIAKKNKIVQTDTYNRTMTHLKWEEKKNTIETYTLTLRKTPNWFYNLVYGIKKIIDDILSLPITQNELDFAADFYENEKIKWWNAYFDKNMWQKVIDENNWFLPLTIKSVEDGTIMKAGEPVMTITWPAELAAVYEPVFLRMFYQTAVATDIFELTQFLWEWRVTEFGKRAAINEEAHIDAVEALSVWWWLKFTSNDTAVLALNKVLSAWTTAHRYLAAYDAEDEAFENAINKADKLALLVDLVDSIRWIDKIIELKKKYRFTQKVINMRLDSWNLLEQAIYALSKQKENWFLDPLKDKIVIADISTKEQIFEIETKLEELWLEPKKYIVYGLGWLLVTRNKTRDAVSAAYKLTKEWDVYTGKLSNDPIKEAIPWNLNVEIREDARYIVQDKTMEFWERLLKVIYDKWIIYDENILDNMDKARERAMQTIKYVNLPTKKDEETARIREEVKERFMRA